MGKKTFIFLACLLGLTPSKVSSQITPPPNVLVDLSGALINAVIQRPIHQTQPVRDVILETVVVGTSWTQGQVQAELVPHTSMAVVDIVAKGTILSQTVGTQEPVLIYSTTTIPFQVRKRFFLDAHGFGGWPAQAMAKPDTRLVRITTTRGEEDTLSTQIARALFFQDKEEAEAIVARKTRSQLIQQLENEIAPQLASSNRALAQAMAQIKDWGLRLEALHWNSTAQAVHLRARIATSHQAHSQPPAWTKTDDLTVRIHHSVIKELIPALLQGKLNLPASELEAWNRLYSESSSQSQLEKNLEGLLLERLKKIEITLPNQITLSPTRVDVGQGWIMVAWNRK